MKFGRYADRYDSSFMGRGSGRFYADLVCALEIRDGDAVLDVGCGTGSVLSVIRRQSDIVGYGLDASPQMIEAARKKNPDCRFQAGDSAHLPYADASMDVVMACMAYHHFPEQAAFRQEARRVLKPGGRLYICDPRFPGIVRALLNTCFKDAGFYSVRRNASEFERSGFKVQRIIRDLYVQVLCMEKSPSQPDCLIKAE